MNTTGIKKATASISGIPIILNYGEMSESVRYLDEPLAGVIYADSQNKDSDFVKLTVTLVANPKDDDRFTTELAKFRREMIQKFR